MGSTHPIIARPAVSADIATLVALEKSVFAPLGTEYYGEAYFNAWFETNPDGLIVADCGGRVVGYQYSQWTNFAFDDFRHFATYHGATDGGFTRKSHRPDGNAVHCLSECSIMPGAGFVLGSSVIDLMMNFKKNFIVSQSRMPGFDNYAKSVENSNAPPDGVTLDELALWYAIGNAKLVGGKIWTALVGQPNLDLPLPDKKDPVLSGHLRFPGFGLAAILPNCMHDPQSRDYAALLVMTNPTLP